VLEAVGSAEVADEHDRRRSVLPELEKADIVAVDILDDDVAELFRHA